MNFPSIAVSVARIASAVIAILVLAVTLLAWSKMEWYPVNVLAWHARNGNTAHIGEFNVPVSTWVRPDPHSRGLQFDLRHGKFGDLYIELGRKVCPGDRWKQAWETNAKSADPRIAKIAKHFLSTKTTNLMIADQPSLCVEDGLEIFCIPESKERGLTVNFVGSPELRPVFYQTLSRITRTALK
jgi:hypothetical protein